MTQYDFELLCSGNEEVLDQVYLTYYSKVTGILIFKYHCDKSLAEDFFIEALLKFREQALAQKIRYQNLLGYISRIAINLFINHQKQQQKELETRKVFFDQHDSKTELVLSNGLEEEKNAKSLAMEEAFQELGNPCRSLLTDTIVKGVPPRKLVEKYALKNARVLTDKKVRCKKKLLNLYLHRVSKLI